MHWSSVEMLVTHVLYQSFVEILVNTASNLTFRLVCLHLQARMLHMHTPWSKLVLFKMHLANLCQGLFCLMDIGVRTETLVL